jgi:type VI protein secretion system component VasF
MPLTDNEATLLKDVAKRIREEFVSAVTIEMIKAGWSPTRVRNVIKAAYKQCELLDEATINVALEDIVSDFEQKVMDDAGTD